MAGADEVVLYEVDAAGIAWITLNRPDTLNAMNNELMGSLKQAFEQVAADEQVRCVVLAGNGRGFCSGADLRDVAAGGNNTGDSGEDLFNGALRAVGSCPVPTIARIHGPAAGGGFGLALACDITIASDAAFFVATFGPRLGIVPDMGATWNISRRVGRSRALAITMLGERIPAQEAMEIGLIYKSVSADTLDEEIQRVARAFSVSSPDAMTRIRETIDAAHDNSLSDQLDLEMKHQAVLIPRNMNEGAKAFVEKREPKFDGRRRT